MTNEIKPVYPKRGNVYALRDILTVLHLRDSPALMFWHIGDSGTEVDCVIQDSHVDNNDLFSIPDFAESNWRFVEITDEDIPVFRFVRACDDITKYVNIERSIDYDTGEVEEKESYYVVPKGFPRVQDYYLKNPDAYFEKFGTALPE